MVLGFRTSITRAQWEATRALELISERPYRTSCTGTASEEKSAPAGAVAPNVSPPHIFNVSISKIRIILTEVVIREIGKRRLNFDSNKKDAFLSYQTQVKIFHRRHHDFEKGLYEEQSDVDVMME